MVPDAGNLARFAATNARRLASERASVLGQPLSEWRTRARIAVAGASDAPLVVVGHQPEFLHPGVWAKHVIARRLVDRIGGAAINLVVDNDAPQRLALVVPDPADANRSATVLDALSRGGRAFETIPAWSAADIARLRRQVEEVLLPQFDASMMPVFFDAMLGRAGADLVDQMAAGRRAVEHAVGVSVDDVRVSTLPWLPWLAEMALNAEQFAASYNGALAAYRKERRVRGAHRPIPDLAIRDGRVEVAAWAYRDDGARKRVWVESRGSAIRLLADDTRIGEIDADQLRRAALDETVSESAIDPRTTTWNGWRLRPRALTLTIWARLFLADLFIHGIGGAKYDRISDLIIADYFGIAPPPYGCVSATLVPEWLPSSDRSPDANALIARERESRFNPQRTLTRALSGGGVAPAAFDQWLGRRAEAIGLSTRLRRTAPRDRTERRRAFDLVREANGALHRALMEAGLAEAGVAKPAPARSRWAPLSHARELFLGLHTRQSLEKLLDRLPGVEAFRL